MTITKLSLIKEYNRKIYYLVINLTHYQIKKSYALELPLDMRY